jgi:hypothetical protein
MGKSKRNRLTLNEKLTLVISVIALLISSLVGIVTIQDYFANKPFLSFLPLKTLHYYTSATTARMMLVGIVTNPSEKGIVPSQFDLYITFQDSIVHLSPVLLDPTIQFLMNENYKEYDLLTQRQAASSAHPLYGGLAFETTLTMQDIATALRFKLVCTDVTQVQHETEFTIDDFVTGLLPKVGFRDIDGMLKDVKKSQKNTHPRDSETR